jgi:hypothetical protein
MVKSNIQKITAPKPMKKHCTSTTGFDKVTIMGGITSLTHKEVF